jgi:hypothetical protein
VKVRWWEVDCVESSGEGTSWQFGLKFVFGGQHYDEILMPLGGLHKKRAVQRGFGQLLIICSTTEESHRKPGSSWSVAGPSGCILSSSRQSAVGTRTLAAVSVFIATCRLVLQRFTLVLRMRNICSNSQAFVYLPVHVWPFFLQLVWDLHFTPFCVVSFYLLLVDGIDRFRHWTVLPETALGLDLSGDRRSSPEAETKF